jgi:UDP-4-amino-4,6-dideoxy-N-acetyl-beta-L-altrosamine N-acetyltransferase
VTHAAAIRDHIRVMTSDDLHLVLSWRNHPDIRRYMYTKHEIPLAEHQRWFEQASQNPSKHLLIYTEDECPMGFIQLTRLGGTPIADWGFYASPDAPKGTGRSLGRAALKHAFEHLGLHKICGQALAYNEPSIRLHLALGFRQEGLLRDQHYDGQAYHDVLCFGLLMSELQQDQ